MSNNIYTKSGDKGKTGLITGERVDKHNLQIETYGTIDELNAIMGFLRAKVKQKEISNLIIYIQKKLFIMATIFATGRNQTVYKNFSIELSDIEFLEKEIDRFNNKLPTLNNFIIPGDDEVAAICHMSRTICRRAERRISKLTQKMKFDSNNLIFINRLSDLLFVLARKISHDNGSEEKIWV